MTLPAHLAEALRQRLKLPQYAVLRVLVAAARPMPVAEIAVATGLSDATIRRVMETLGDKQLVRRSKVPPVGGAKDRATTYRVR